MPPAKAPLTVQLEFARAEQAGDPYGFRFAPQDYLLRRVGGGFESAQLSWDSELVSDLSAARLPGRDPAVLQRIGERLRAFVTPLGWAEQAQAILRASREGQTVLVTVRSAAAELYALPWELLTLKASGQHLGELSGVLLRYEWPETQTTRELPTPRAGGGRILLGWSAAGGEVPAAEHRAAIERACQKSSHPFSPEQDVLPHASLGQLKAALATAQKEGRPISVLHLLCHGSALGSSFGLMMNGEAAGDEDVVVDAGRLRQVLAPHAGMVRLVVLTACDSGNSGALGNQLGSVAQALHRAGIASVVASRYPLYVPASILLTETLYQRLLVDLASLEEALLASREKLLLEAARLDWASVQLYARAADGDGTRPLVFRPYQGLSAFDVEDHRFFFGRRALIDKLWQRGKELFERPSARRILFLLGPSGSGKSSVARAGLLGELDRRDGKGPSPYRTAMFKPGGHPLRALASALATLPPDDSERPLLLLVDQLEEIYTLCEDRAERDAFVALLLIGADAPERSVSILVTLRSDFLGETQLHHRELNQLIAAQHELVPALSDAELRQVIAEPARSVGRELDGATIELLLSEARDCEGALPLLEFALARIWEGMLAGTEAAVTLQKMGGVGGALAGKAYEVYETLNPSEKSTARRALVRLVQLGEGRRDTRRRAPVRELCGRGETDSGVLSILRRFAAPGARLVTLSGDGAETIAEFTHEAIFDHWRELRTWIDEGRADRRFHDRVTEAAQLWNEAGRPAGRLWRPPDLELLRRYRQRQPADLSPLQEEFLVAAERQQRRERRFRWGSAGAICGALLAAVAIYTTKELQLTREARERSRQEREAEERIRQQLLAPYVEQGRQLLVDKANPAEALLWLHRARAQHSNHPDLPLLLRGALHSIGIVHRVLLAHEAAVSSARYSPDGKRIVTASDDPIARIWDADSGSLLTELKGHTEPLRFASYSSDGRRIITTSLDKTARVWDAESGKFLFALTGHTDPVLYARYSPDGRHIATASTDSTARIWNAESGKFQTELKMRDVVLTAEWSPDGRSLLTASIDGSTVIWNLATGKPIAGFHAFGSRVNSAAYSPDGRRVVITSWDSLARIVDAGSGDLVAELRGHAGPAHSAEYSPDGRLIVTASFDHTARVWDAQSGRLLAEIRSHGDSLSSASFRPDSRRIVTTSHDHTARVWDAETGELLALKGHPESIESAAYSKDGRRIVTANDDTTARIFDADTGRLLTELKSPGVRINNDAAFSPDGRRVVTASFESTARVWDSDTGKLVMELKGHLSTIWGAQYSPDGRRIVTASGDGTACIWEAGSGRLLLTLKGHRDGLHGVAYSRDNKKIVTTSWDQTARVWAADSGQLLVTLKGHSDLVNGASFSPDGGRIVTASDDGTARVWTADTGQLIAELKGHSRRVWRAAYSPNGRHVVTASDDATARVWVAGTGQLLAELRGHGHRVFTAEYSPDGRRILTASADRTARIWDVSPDPRTPEEIGKLLRCYLPIRFESDSSNVILPAQPDPDECQIDTASRP